MEVVFNNICRIFFSFNGIFINPPKNFLITEIEEEFQYLIEDIEFSPVSDDKNQLHNDSVKFKKDFKKSIKSYKKEKV